MLSRAGLVAAMLFVASTAQAQVSFYGTGGDVWVKYMGCDAAFTSDLSAAYTIGGSSSFTNLFTCHVTSVGTEVNLGPVNPGSEVIFSLFVRNTGFTYYTGPGVRNPDNIIHANAFAITGDGVYQYQFGFEDVFGGGDQDFNDNVFRVGGVSTQSTVPEPASMALMATGIAGLAAARRRRKQKG